MLPSFRCCWEGKERKPFPADRSWLSHRSPPFPWSKKGGTFSFFVWPLQELSTFTFHPKKKTLSHPLFFLLLLFAKKAKQRDALKIALSSFSECGRGKDIRSFCRRFKASLATLMQFLAEQISRMKDKTGAKREKRERRRGLIDLAARRNLSSSSLFPAEWSRRFSG